MSDPGFQRARSADAKRARETAILDAARRLATERGTRDITLGDIAAQIGMHKSALLRYFETREHLFLRLAAEAWDEWTPVVVAALGELSAPTPTTVATTLIDSLITRPLFCDLLAHIPLNLERHASADAVREYKLTSVSRVREVQEAVRDALPGLTERQASDAVGGAISLIGAFWQMATPPPEIAELYRSEPLLAHAIPDVGPRVIRLTTATLAGFLATASEG